MHELSLCTEILALIIPHARDEGAERIVSVRLVVGPRSGVDGRAMAYCFATAAHGTIAEHAKLIVETPTLRVLCPDCQYRGPCNDPWELSCTRCGETNVVPLGGHELQVAAIEITH